MNLGADASTPLDPHEAIGLKLLCTLTRADLNEAEPPNVEAGFRRHPRPAARGLGW